MKYEENRIFCGRGKNCNWKDIVTARKRSLGGGNVFTPVCDSVHNGRCLLHCWDTPPWADTPLVRHPPHLGRYPLGRYPPGQTPLGRHPLGKHPLGRHPSLGRRPIVRHPQGDPPFRYYGIWTTSGWYTSYWNAYLFCPNIGHVFILSDFKYQSRR